MPFTTCSSAMANSSGLKERPSRTSLRGVATLYQGSIRSSGRSPRHREQHRVEQALLFAPLRVERRERVGEAQEVGAAVLLGLEQRAQRVGAATGGERPRGAPGAGRRGSARGGGAPAGGGGAGPPPAPARRGP